MRVWLINHYASSPKQPGITRHFDFARGMSERGHEVLVVASSFDHVTRREIHLQQKEHRKKETIDGVPFLWIKTPPYKGNGLARVVNMLAFSWKIWRSSLLKNEVKPDVIIGSSPHLFSALAAERLASNLRIPFLLEVVDLWPQTFVDLGRFSSDSVAVRALEAIERYLYRKASRIITALPRAHEHMQQKGVSTDKIDWVPNGVDLRAVPKPTPPRESNRLQIVYAGAHGFANGLDHIIDAAKFLQEAGWGQRAIFHLIGDGPEKSRLQKRVEREAIHNIRFEPPVTKQEIHCRLREADAFIIIIRDSVLYRWGISPNKIADYMAAARPILFCGEAINNIVEEAGAGLTVRSLRPNNIAQAVKTLVETPSSERWRMGLSGYKYVTEQLSIDRLTERIEMAAYASLSSLEV